MGGSVAVLAAVLATESAAGRTWLGLAAAAALLLPWALMITVAWKLRGLARVMRLPQAAGPGEGVDLAALLGSVAPDLDAETAASAQAMAQDLLASLFAGGASTATPEGEPGAGDEHADAVA